MFLVRRQTFNITGTDILQTNSEGRREFEFVKGPLFGNVILADEINRTPPKTQSALLEAMQEHLAAVMDLAEARDGSGNFRLAVDRSFPKERDHRHIL